MSTLKTNTRRIVENIQRYRYNPANIRRSVLEYLRDATEGQIDVVDVTTPFGLATESSAMLTAAFMVENATNTRKQYPSLAQTVEDLYHHMSDKDYLDRFASPASAKFKLWLDMDELKRKLVLDPQTGIKKAVIPPNTEFTIGEYTFSLQYPIEIKQLSHGGFQVVYDVSEESPLQRLSTNLVDWRIEKPSQIKQEMLVLEIEVQQIKIRSYKGDLISSTGYKAKHRFEDQYCYARVYYKNQKTNGQWVEMKTTHTEQVHDSQTPTAVLKVLHQELLVHIPQIYFTNQSVSGGIRVDIYQTKGPIHLMLDNYKVSHFNVSFLMIDKTKLTPEMAAIQSMSNVFTYCHDTVVGGKDALSFEKLRERVIFNSVGDRHLPITNVQIEKAIENKGFTIVKNVDVVTNRQFLATKKLPAPFDDKLVTAANASIGTIITSMDQLKIHPLVRDHGHRLTLTPECVYTNENGIIRLLGIQELENILQLQGVQREKLINQNNYLYTPFHYVLDSQKDSFEIRAYDLNHPSVESTQFVSQNDTTGLQVNTLHYRLTKTVEGYHLFIETISNEPFKALDNSQVFVQLAYTPVGQNQKAFLNGRLVQRTDQNEYLFVFHLATGFDVDHLDQLVFDSFSLLHPEKTKTLSRLVEDFELFYSVSKPMDAYWQIAAEDQQLGKYLLPQQVYFVTKEQLKLSFGKALKNLWSSSRSIPAASEFQRYTEDVPAVYEEDIYERDPVTGEIFTIGPTGKIEYKLLHKAGETVLNNGQIVYKHRKGDPILDIYKRPIPVSEMSLLRQMDLFFIEGCYFFATDVASSIYRDTIVKTVVQWITHDLALLNQQLLEQTKVYYYPKSTMGNIRVINDQGNLIHIDANQSFQVKLYVDETVYSNEHLRQQLTKTTVKIIDQALEQSTVSVSGITSDLKKAYGQDVLGFDVSGFGQQQSIQMYTILNEGDRGAIRKKVQALSDGKMIVVEDVSVDFILHRS